MSWEPRFTLEARTARALMRIEGARTVIEGLPVTPQLLASLRQSARLLATHYSTQIEGNQLTPEQVAAVAKGGATPCRKFSVSKASTISREVLVLRIIVAACWILSPASNFRPSPPYSTGSNWPHR